MDSPTSGPPTPAPAATAAPRGTSWRLGSDALALLIALGAGLRVWLGERWGATAWRPDGAPWWASFKDHLLEGPDAGAWASNATALSLGRLDDLDPHRLPTLPYLTTFAMRLTDGDPALAGHLVNHLAHAALGPVVYLLGRRWMGRGMALGAALAAVFYPEAVHAADRYGIDPVVTLALPTALLAAELSAWRWWLAPLGGILAAFCGASHLTTIGIPAVALFACLLRGSPGWRRWLGALAFAGGLYIGGGLIFAHYPVLEWKLFTGSLAEGVAPTGGEPGSATPFAKAIATVRAGGPQALDQTIAWLAMSTRPRWLPWAATLVLPWLGLFGFGLPPRTPRPPRPGRLGRAVHTRLGWLLGGLRAGLPLSASLVPLLAFAAAGSPDRYTDNFIGLGALLMFRGGDVVVRNAERLLRRASARWPLGAAGVVVGIAAVIGHYDAARIYTPLRMPPTPQVTADWRLGALIRQHFPPGGGASCTRREAVAYAGRVYCPYSNGPNFRSASEPFRAQLTEECTGEGDIPYVVIVGDTDAGTSEHRKRMDAWVESQGEPVAELDEGGVRARVYAVARVR